MLLFTPARRFRCHVDSRELLRLFLINVLLNILTLGVYRFWGKTRLRHYLWSQASFDDERFMYTGQGHELFRGFLVAFAVTGGLLIASQKASSFFLAVGPEVEPLVRLVISYLMYILIGAGMYGARRYVLSRSQWRGIRFALSGSTAAYAKTWISTQGLSILTLGLYTPFMRHHLFSYTLNHTWYGSEPVIYNGDGKALFTYFLKPYLLLVPTFGLSWFWYRAAEYRYLAAHTQLQGVRFSTTINGSDLLRLTLGNWLLLIVTLGLAYPFTILRKARVVSLHMQMIGDFAYARILQNEQYLPVSGEGLAGVFGMGSI
jgi:uncharacterized membrane protein YjgN (DUF898 family)